MKIDRNMSKLRQSVCKNIVLILVLLWALLYEFCKYVFSFKQIIVQLKLSLVYQRSFKHCCVSKHEKIVLFVLCLCYLDIYLTSGTGKP
jgi:hypothetical protein